MVPGPMEPSTQRGRRVAWIAGAGVLAAAALMGHDAESQGYEALLAEIHALNLKVVRRVKGDSFDWGWRARWRPLAR